VKRSCVSLGRSEYLVSRNGLSALEHAMGDASARINDILCHELYMSST